jgi:hypothetical protein
MRQKTLWTAGCVLGLILTASNAQAQMLQWEDRGYIAVNVGVQAPSRSFTETSAPEIYEEPSSVTVPHEIGAGVLFDAAGVYRVWRNLGVGVGFSTFGSSETATVTAEIPNPLAQDSHRTATADAGEMERRETAVHILGVWMVPMTNEFDFAIVGGPSIYTVKQDLVTGLTPVEGAPPFTTVTISNVTVDASTKTSVGFTIGADGTYVLTPRYGIGFFARYSLVSADLPAAGGGTIEVDAGGLQLGGGIRVRF